MDKFKLGPPLDWRFLRKVTTTLRQEGWADPGNVAGWLARHPTAEQMIEAIRDAWLGTSLPPREWAAGIDGVEVWCLRDDLGLGVHVSHDSEMTVWQAPPMEPAALEAMAAAFPEALPKLLEELALSVPGLVFDRFGNRVGYGLGHYDKYLAEHELRWGKKPHLIATAHDDQVIPEKILNDLHDVKVDIVATPSLLYRTIQI